jgi:hypothetical protein
MQLTHFQEALRNLGPNDDERARALGVDDRTIRGWRAKEPRIIRILASRPELVRALIRDAEQLADPIETAA